MFNGLLKLGPDGVYPGLHILLMYVHLGFNSFFSGLCSGLVDIHPGDESTSKGLKLRVITFILASILSSLVLISSRLVLISAFNFFSTSFQLSQ
jgi:hypothetical protein